MTRFHLLYSLFLQCFYTFIERALYNKHASDEGFSILSLPINTNGNETFQIIANSTETASPVGILFDAGCETSATFLSTV